MKKTLSGLIAATMLVAGGSALAASNSATQTVDASVNATISIQVSSGASFSPTLTPGATFTDATSTVLTLNSTGPYTVTAAADTDANKTTANYLWEWDGTSAYVSAGASVAAPVQISAVKGTATGTDTSGAPADLDTTGITIFTGDGATSGGTVKPVIQVAVPWGTSELPTATPQHTYHMVITYTATTSAV